jgi:uncharacterized protein (DUF58 family)
MTEPGRVLLHGAACILLASLIVPAFGVLAALVTVLLTALVAGFILRPRVLIRGNLPESVTVGQVVRLRYQLENTARVSAYGLSVELDSLPPSIEPLDGSQVVPRLIPGGTADVTVSFTARRRGRFLMPAPVCRSGFPFNLFIFGLSREGRQPLLVLPPVFPLRLPLQDRAVQVDLSGSGWSGRTEISPEYAGNRPFVAGDSPRRIDVRAWARLSVPATKEYYTTQERLVSLVLDSRLRGASSVNAEPDERFEAAVCLCASVASSLDRDCSIDAAVIGSTLHPFSQIPKSERFDVLHRLLATVEPSDDYDLETVFQDVEERWRMTSEVVFILLAWDRTYGRLIELAAKAGCHTTVVLIGDATAATPGPSRRVDDESTVWAARTAVPAPRDVLEGRVTDL